MDFTKFKGTAEERVAWVRQMAQSLLDEMNDNLLVDYDGDGDYDWLDYKDSNKGVDTYKTLNAISKFLIIASDDLVADFFDHKGFKPNGFID